MNSGCCILAMSSIMVFGESLGKYFVTFCVLVSQINMAYCDTVTDALTVQASKTDVEDVNESLNSFAYSMQAVGAIAGALMANMVQNNAAIGPFQCFGIYMCLQIFFFMSTLFMNKDLEPEELDQQVPREIQQQEGDVEESALLEINDEIPHRQMTNYEKFCLNVKLIGNTLKHKKILNALTFFFVTGMMIPAFEDFQFFFLLDKCGISQA